MLCGGCLCTVASLPPTVQFLSEVSVLSEAGWVRFVFIMGLFVYLFCGGLVPIFLLGSLLTRHYSIRFGPGNVFGGVASLLLLLLWRFLLFLVC